MRIKKENASDITELVVTSFTDEEILTAKTELIEFCGMVVPGGHNDTAERTAAFLYAKELVSLVHELDKSKRMPRVVVSSDQLARVPLGKIGLSPSDAIPIGARMNDLEDTVKKLCDSFEKFRSDNIVAPAAPSFATLGVGLRQTVPQVSVTGPPQSGQ